MLEALNHSSPLRLLPFWHSPAFSLGTNAGETNPGDKSGDTRDVPDFLNRRKPALAAKKKGTSLSVASSLQVLERDEKRVVVRGVKTGSLRQAQGRLSAGFARSE